MIVVMDSRMEREQLKTAVSSQRARYSIVSNTAVGYGSIGAWTVFSCGFSVELVCKLMFAMVIPFFIN